MFAKERQEKIMEILKMNGAVTTSHLVELFQVSIETVRKDLLYMEQKSLLTRVHGGAVPIHNTRVSKLGLAERDREYVAQKKVLVQKAMEFIQEGDVIGIDAGSTAKVFAHQIRERFQKLTVVTYSLDVFQLLREKERFSVILCGGLFMEQEQTFYGAMTIEMLKMMNVQKAFVFPAAISLHNGICDNNADLYLVQKQLVKAAGELYVLADGSKLEKRATYKLMDMIPNAYYITDSGVSEEIKRIYQENNIKIYIGEEHES